MAAQDESIALMEPMLPTPGHPALEDLSVRLAEESAALAAQLPEKVRVAVGDLVRSMNCYYSNLIEGHNTRPRDIDRALRQDYVQDPERRKLQLEAVAHIHVQSLIDSGQDPAASPTSFEYLTWVHREFCSRLPPELLVVTDPDTGRKSDVAPGKLRTQDVAVGRHIPPRHASLPAFLVRLDDAYRPDRLSRVQQLISVGAAHHRLLWIHPFLDGNGRVARLVAHAMLKRIGVGSSLWAVSRGLARRVGDYRRLLEAADEPRRSDLDGRGTLSEAALGAFCQFFLEAGVDQVSYMAQLLDAPELIRRVQIHMEEETRAGRLPYGAFDILREVLLVGEIERARARDVTGYRERKGREVLSALLRAGLLTSESDRSPVRVGFPVDVVERWFPNLYPAVN
jgi:Fic family protein